MKLLIMPGALRSLAGMQAKERESLRAKLLTFAADPFAPHPWAKAFGGQKGRIRQGDWRAIYRIDAEGQLVVVDAVENRRDVYR